ELLERLEPVYRLRKQFAPSGRRLAIPTCLETAEINPRSLGAALEGDFRAKGAAIFGADRADFAERRRLESFLGVVFQYQSGIKNFLEILSNDDDAVAAQESGALIADNLHQGVTALGVGDEPRLGADRHAVAEDGPLQGDRLKPAFRDRGECRVRRVEVRDGEGVGTGAVQRRGNRP